MRHFIRHPSGMPLDVRQDQCAASTPENLDNIGYGGLSFTSQAPFLPGTLVSLRVPVSHVNLETRGRVAWCRERPHGFEVGIDFLDPGEFYTVRMVEQVCHIEHYRNQVREQQGRMLTSQQAAEEWIDKYAGDFPAAVAHP